jgi:hypothetical protein
MVAVLRPEQVVLTDAARGRKASVVDHRFRGDHSALTVTGEGFRLNVRSMHYGGEKTVYLRVEGGCMAFAAEP